MLSFIGIFYGFIIHYLNSLLKVLHILLRITEQQLSISSFNPSFYCLGIQACCPSRDVNGFELYDIYMVK